MICKVCQKEKETSAFYKYPHTSTFWQTCRTCVANDRKKRGTERIKKYGMSPAEYDLRLLAQGFKCAICGTTQNCAAKGGGPRGFAVDHDHKCCPERKACFRCIRGLLCNNCNKGLGHFKDNPALLTAAANYLQSYVA